MSGNATSRASIGAVLAITVGALGGAIGCGGLKLGDLGAIISADPNSILDPNEPQGRLPGDGRPRTPDITDGTDNTIIVGEDDPTGTPAPRTPTTPTTPPAQGGRVDLDGIRAALEDRVHTSNSFEANSDSDIFLNGETNLQLCAFGRFGMREFSIFSTEFGSFESEDFSNGTWTLVAENGRAVLTLTIEQSTNERAPASRSFIAQVDAGGRVLLNGNVAQSTDAAADCAAARN